MMNIPRYVICREYRGSDDLSVFRAPEQWAPSSIPVALDNDNSHSRMDQYVYMDVGRWGGTSRNFGVIYGDQSESYVAVCQYIPPPAQGRPDSFTPVSELPGQTNPSSSVARTVIDFINHCRGDILHAARFVFVDTRGKLYLALGDLHLPLVNHLSRPTTRPLPEIQCRVDAAYMQRLNSEENFTARAVNAGIIAVAPGVDRMMIDSPIRWYERYIASDIFTDPSSNAAADDLRNFINLAQGSGNTNIHFVQLGDMYELWVGVKCLFVGTQSNRREVNLLRLGFSGVCGDCYLHNTSSLSQGGCTITSSYRETIREWVCLAHRTTQAGGESLAEWLHRERFRAQTWLYGNHDNYLRILSAQLFSSSRLTRRLVLYERESQIQFEHGHEADEYNRDGAVSGHAITQGAAFLWDMRRLESLTDRRRDFILYAGRKFMRTADPIKVFVMAHTHNPYLAIVILNI